MIKWIRKLLGWCDHQWKVVKTLQMAEFDSEETALIDNEIISMRDFDKLQCQKCSKFRFKKV